MLCYICQTHNHFGVGSATGSSSGLENHRTPVELLLQKDRPKPVTSMFGSVCMAKVPESLIDQIPEKSRFVPAAYMYIKPNSLAHVVTTQISGKEHTFQAEVKPLDRLMWDVSMCPSVLKEIPKTSRAELPSSESMRPPRPLDDQVGAGEALPSTGPPRPWIQQYGPTPDCTACNASSRHGRKHSAACCRRYRDWVESERRRLSGSSKGQEDPSSGHQAGSDVLPKPDHPTGHIRYSEKKPPVSGDREPAPEMSDGRLPDAPNADVRWDPPSMEVDPEYEPSIPDELPDVAMNDGMDGDPSRMPMDISQFLRLLSPPPEELIRESSSQGIFCPIFVPSKQTTKLTSEPFEFCGCTVFLIDPELGLSEDGQTTFPPELVKAGRLIELVAMNKLTVGVPIEAQTAKAMASELHIRIIGSRWVLTSKTVEGVPNQCRARCVVQDVAAGAQSAHHLGISSSTPSVEAFRSFLAAVQHYNMWLTSLDISTAFLHSQLPNGIRAIVRMPADVSFAPDAYEPVFLDLYRAMNGLRVASKAWLNTCSRILRDNAGLLKCPSEQTTLAGVTKKSNSPSIVLVYVDDPLVGSLSPRGIQDIRGALEESLKVKTTGMITNASKEGGRITFLGREIIRPNQSDRLLVRVPPNYLEELFADDPFCQDLKGTPVPPDLLQILEKAHRSPETITILSESCK